jgi:hypothetical protein
VRSNQLPARLRTVPALSGLALAITTAAQSPAASTVITARAAAGTVAAPAPIPVNTVNWSGSAGFGSRHPAWYTDGSGVVHLQGAAHQTSSSGANANLIGTLPAAARPAHIVCTIVSDTFGSHADLAIGTDGTIKVIATRPPLVTDYTFVSLESVTYRR